MNFVVAVIAVVVAAAAAAASMFQCFWYLSTFSTLFLLPISLHNSNPSPPHKKNNFIII